METIAGILVLLFVLSMVVEAFRLLATLLSRLSMRKVVDRIYWAMGRLLARTVALIASEINRFRSICRRLT